MTTKIEWPERQSLYSLQAHFFSAHTLRSRSIQLRPKHRISYYDACGISGQVLPRSMSELSFLRARQQRPHLLSLPKPSVETRQVGAHLRSS